MKGSTFLQREILARELKYTENVKKFPESIKLG
jgi:hypothetical protein